MIEKKEKKVALLGGTFNPIHFGHIDLALKIKAHFKIDKTIFIPSNIPPHKSKENLAPANVRYLMIKEALKEYKEFEISKEEIEREGTSYSIDTIKKMQKKYQNDTLYLILGLDAFFEIDTWKAYKEILSLISIIVINRHYEKKENFNIYKIKNYINKITNIYKFSEKEKKFIGLNTKNIFIADLNIKPISSSLIRDKIKNNEISSDLLPENVLKIIREHKLYT